MQRASWTLLASASILLAAPASAWSTTFDVDSVEATDVTDTKARLAALFVDGVADPGASGMAALNGPPPSDPRFVLQAAEMEVQERWVDVFAPGDVNSPQPAKTRTVFAGEGSVEGLRNRENPFLWVLASGPTPPRISLDESPCSQWVQPGAEDDEVRRTHPIYTDETDRELTVFVGPAIQWRACSDARATIEGDFILILWNHDAVLHSTDGRQTLQSGPDADLDFQDAPGRTPTTGSAREHILIAHGATLTVPLRAETYEAYLTTPRVRSAEFILRGADGTLPGEPTARVNDDIRLHGALALDLDRASGASTLLASLDGTIDWMSIDGSVIPQTLAAPGPGGPAATALLLVVGVPMALYLLFWHLVPLALHVHVRRHHPEARAASLRQRRAQAWSWLSDEADARSRAWTSLFFARLAAWCHPNPSYLVQRVRAQRNLGHVEAAMRTHARIDRWLQGDDRNRARNAWHAYSLANRHEHHAASLWLERSRRYHPMEFLDLSKTWRATGAVDHALGDAYT